MSEVQQELEMESPASAEDKFFGVKTTIGKKGEVSQDESDSEVSDIEYEIVDDRPPEDRRPPKAETASQNEDDDELSGYSEKVQKRINKLRYEQNEERRQREASERMRDEAVKVAQVLANKNKEYEALINRGEGALINTVKQKAEMTLEVYGDMKKANETGDGPVDAIFKCIKKLYPHDVKLQLYQVHAVTEGTDAQATVSVRIEEKGKTTVGQAADTDTLVASANAYLNALNKMLIKREKKSLYKNIEPKKLKESI